MNTYFQLRLALIDMEIDSRVRQKKIIDYELTNLYELREDLVVQIAEQEEEHKCGNCND